MWVRAKTKKKCPPHPGAAHPNLGLVGADEAPAFARVAQIIQADEKLLVVSGSKRNRVQEQVVDDLFDGRARPSDHNAAQLRVWRALFENDAVHRGHRKQERLNFEDAPSDQEDFGPQAQLVVVIVADDDRRLVPVYPPRNQQNIDPDRVIVLEALALLNDGGRVDRRRRNRDGRRRRRKPDGRDRHPDRARL